MSSIRAFSASDRIERVRAHSLRPSTRPPTDIVSLASGEPDFDTEPHIVEALVEAIRGGATHYGAWDGDPELRAALAAQASAPAGRAELTAAHVLMTHGGSGALAAAITACVDPGDRVVIPSPTYSLYADLVRFSDGQPEFVPNLPDQHLDLDAIAAAAPGARMIVICNPCNPTGAVFGRDELLAVAAIAEREDLLVLVDEAYEHIVYGDPFTSALDIPELGGRRLVAQTFSKTYAMTGWRVGHLIAEPEVIRAAALAHRSFVGPMNTAVQRAALAAVTGDQRGLATRLAEYRERRRIVLDVLGDVPGVRLRPPEGTFYALVGHDPSIDSVEMAARAREHGVAVRAGSEFGPGGDGYIRLSFATSRARLRQGLELVRDVIGAGS